MKFINIAISLIVLTLSGCDFEEVTVTNFIPEKADYDVAFKRLEFTCVHESDVLPPLNSDAHILYRYALDLTQSKGPKDFNQAARLYRIAAAYGHYRAATNLQGLLSQGLTNAPRPARETINLVEEFMERNIPGAYYDLGHYLELGYGVRQDTEAARYYFRRAADLGNPEAQYYVADQLFRLRGAGKTASQMRICAMEQGHVKAAGEYGASRQNHKDFIEALRGYQVAVRQGDSVRAMTLKIAFTGVGPEKDIHYLALDQDNERSRRYGLIEEFLGRYEHLGAKVPDIDQIVPLPPAKLPEWDETFEWKRKRDAAVPPSPPSEELIARMCEEKQLDPATGWPLNGLR